MGLPTGEVGLHEVMEWAQDQAQFLTPTQTLVLWYLTINAFRTDNNREGREPGDVMSGRTALRKIQMRTGLSQRAVRYALDDLQDLGYIYADHRPGNGRSRVAVFWSEGADERRAEARAGVRALPEGLKRTQKSREPHLKVVTEATVTPIRSGN